MVHQDHLNNAKQTGHKTGLLSLYIKCLRRISNEGSALKLLLKGC